MNAEDAASPDAVADTIAKSTDRYHKARIASSECFGGELAGRSSNVSCASEGKEMPSEAMNTAYSIEDT